LGGFRTFGALIIFEVSMGRIIVLALLCFNGLAWSQGKPVATIPVTFDSAQFYNNTKKRAIADSAIQEYAPTIQADGKTIIIEARKPGSTKWDLFQTHLENGKWSEIEALTKINASGDSSDLIGGPSISFDGNVLYFFRSTKTGGEEIFYSERTKEGWSDPVTIGAPINTAGYEAFPSISADGTTLYFIRQNILPVRSKELRKLDGQFNTSIFKSVKDSKGNWGKPTKLPWPINQDSEKAPRIMADGRTLIFSSNRPHGKEKYDPNDYDMYQSKLNDLGEWSMPENLSFVNTDKSDQSPCISAQGDLMYYTFDNKDIYSITIPYKFRQFVNNIVQGFVTDIDSKGGLDADVIVTDALTSEQVLQFESNAADGRFTLVLPVGRNFNIEFRKNGYSSYTHFVDLRSVKKYQEITVNVGLFKTVRLEVTVNDRELFEPVVAKVKVNERGKNEYIKEVRTNARTGQVVIELPIGKTYEILVSALHFKDSKLSFHSDGLIIYRDFKKYVDLIPEKFEVPINVTDLTNNSKVKSKVLLKNKTRGEVIEVDGNTTVSLRSGDRYEIEVTSDQGYSFTSTALDLTDGKFQPINVSLQKLDINTRLALRDINFETNSDLLNDISFTELNRVIKLMQENPHLKMEVAAHTDDKGPTDYNLILSNKRAKSVMTYLTASIPMERLIAKGYGEGLPKVENKTEENRATNRRVELKVLSN
jgi:outer membrane protein OmpA-like peptidoglycan-associated protein/Tol biopolymer transport system component